MNGSGRANAASTPEALRAAGLTAMLAESAHSVTVPGAVSAWAKLNASHGKLGLDRLLQPAIRAAEDGFFVHARVAHDWAEATGKLRNNAASTRHYLKDGAAPVMGDRMRFPALAATLRRIAKEGAGAFYEGAVAATWSPRCVRPAGCIPRPTSPPVWMPPSSSRPSTAASRAWTSSSARPTAPASSR
jgi:gamma-glutamyltranspeptidase/glutathione hydrolase